MNKLLYIIFLVGITTIASCTKDPEKIPLEGLTEDYVFDPNDKNGVLAEQFLNNIYSHLPDGFNRISGDFLASATDDALPSRNNNNPIEVLRTGGLNSSSSNPDGAWADSYTGIRKANLFLSKIDITPVDEQVKNNWKADARFLRALFYFELVKRYGGVPLVGDVVYNPTDKIDLPRNTFEECVNYIVTELDAIQDLVRPYNTSATNDSDWGRITKGVVLTLKAKILNYAASPLYNGGNIAIGTPSAAYQGYLDYDVNRWQKAADAAKAVIDLGTYQLVGYTDIFIERKNSEMILAKLRPTTRDIMLINGPIAFEGANVKGQGMTSPTQNLVDAFHTINGNSIDDDPAYNPNDPYANRDPRLQFSVFLNGTDWLQRPLEFFEGGRDKPNIPGQYQTRTGYYSKKYMNFRFQTSLEYSLQHVNYQIFRYADVLLMYAEALNELNSMAPQEVHDVLRDIRKRGGIREANNYGVPATLTQAEARELIQLERRIEFFMEEQRYWDVRRWKIAETEFNKDLEGMRITKSGSNLSYEKFVADQIVFEAPRMYMYPIPNVEILRNTNLVQNIGW